MSLSASRRARAGMIVAALCISSATAAQALTIKPIFDSSVTSLANASVVEAAFNAVANQFDASFADPVTIKIGVSWGKVNGSALPGGDIAASQSGLTGPFAYSDMVDAFHADAAANPADPYLAKAAASLPKLSPAGSLPYELPYAEAQALGLLPAQIYADSGFVGFSSSVRWDFNPTGGVTAGYFDFEGLAAHEISEVLGRVTGLQNARPAYATMFDTLRYSAAHKSSFAYNQGAYFSIDGGVTNLGQFNINGAGDRSDLNGIAGDAQDAVLTTGTVYGLSQSDMVALDVLGWGSWTPLAGGTQIGNGGLSGISGGMGVPEPSAWIAMLAGFAFVGAALRRRAPRLA